MDIFVSWCPGLEKDKEAIRILKECELIAGLEVWQLKLAEELRKAGIKTALHNSIKELGKDLSDHDLLESLDKNPVFFQEIRLSEAKSIGFHIYYKAMAIYNHLLFNTQIEEEKLKDEGVECVRKELIRNLLLLEERINHEFQEKDKMFVLFESYPYADLLALAPVIKSIDPEHEKIIGTAAMFNIPEIIKSILYDKSIKENNHIGIIFDVAHIFCAINGLVGKGIIQGPVDEIMKEVIEACKGKVHELHLNTPKRINGYYYRDSHGDFKEGEELSLKIIEYAKAVISSNPQLKMITLEINTRLDPVSHVKKLIEQTELIRKELKL